MTERIISRKHASALKDNLRLLAILLLMSVVTSPTASASDWDEATERFIKSHVNAGFNLRLRNEIWNTFERQGAETDNTFDFFLVRARGFVDVSWEKVTFHVMGQGVQALNLPKNGAFGPGALYFAANGRDEDPGALHLAEISLQIKDLPIEGLYIKGGRIGIKEGAEVLYGEPKFDWVKRARLSERLVGNWDWVNVGRRYDGGALGYTNDWFNINLFGANVLQGGFDIDDGYKRLDSVVVVGGAFTFKKDVLVPNTELRVFNIFYFDDRRPADELAGDDLEINTLGGSLVGVYDLSPGQIDLLLWSAFQTGNFGDLDQLAFSFIGEIGYQLVDTPWHPWLRFGVAYASGDDDASDSDHGTFFNLVPTNHKFYGYMDSVALSNIVNYYTQLILQPCDKVNITVDGHFFRLASDDEVWIGGSGPFNNELFGYAFLSPAPGNSIEKNLGGELDLTVKFKPIKYTSFDIGYSHFFGGAGVESVFEKEDQMNWFYVQAVVSL